jgi:Fic family protein
MLINTIPLLEAKDSSEIENIVTTADRLFQFAQGADRGADAATKEALRYRTALYAGFESLSKRPLSTATAVEICLKTLTKIETTGRVHPDSIVYDEASKRVVTHKDSSARGEP